MFTTNISLEAKSNLIQSMSRLLASELPLTFLFCIREDYLPELYSLSADLPELYDRQNTFRLHRLSPENAMRVMDRASEVAKLKLSPQLSESVVEDLLREGEGNIYPPYLQIIGHRLYAAAKRSRRILSKNEIPESLYHGMGRAEKVVNDYLDGLLDTYQHDDKPTVARILRTMVTEHHTKKRVTEQFLQEVMPECKNLPKLLSSLVQHRIVRPSLGEYELMHDFLAKKVVQFIDEQNFLSPPVRNAVKHIELNCHLQSLTIRDVAEAAGVSQAHLAVLFRSQMGRTITRHLNAKRVTKAKSLLIATREPMGAIAQQVGFSGQSVFSRIFNQIEGIPPMEFRKTYAKTKA